VNRTATAVFGLIYPAILGTLLFGLFQNPIGKGSSSLLAVLLILYFVLQYVQGQAASEIEKSTVHGQEHRGYLWGDALADLAEVATMLGAFSALGFFGAPTVRSEQTAAILSLIPVGWMETECRRALWVAAVFVLPPAIRLVDRLGTKHDWWPKASPKARPSHLPGHNKFLTALSLLAATGAMLEPAFGNWALVLVAVPLLVYWLIYLTADRGSPN
jgi:hypothetical protein